MVSIDIFSGEVKPDRYRLLKHNVNPSSSDVIYSETGNAFNGFDNPFILNESYDIIKESRLCRIKDQSLNFNEYIYCLINDIKPIRNNKCAVFIEPDAWMQNRSHIVLGDNNTLFTYTGVIPYSYRDFIADYKVMEKESSINPCTKWNVLIVYHDSENNIDKIYLLQSNVADQFPFYSNTVMGYLEGIGIDSNNIIGVYLSPFDVVGSWPTDFQNEWIIITHINLDVFISYQYQMQYESRFTWVLDIVSDYRTKTAITDMNGAIVWQSQRKDSGAKYLHAKLDITYDQCAWLCGINDDPDDEKQDSPSVRFVINCVNLAYYIDYYQAYQNTQKSFNAELRQAQLEKELIVGVGNTVSSSVYMGTISTLQHGPVGGAIGTVAGLAAGLAQNAITYEASKDHDKKVADIENRQAKVQYDSITASNNSFLAFLTGEIVPSVYRLKVDDESALGQTNVNGLPFLNYNCRILASDAKSLITIRDPDFISGDFDFMSMSLNDAYQLNSRFKHGVNYVDWK